VSENNANPNPNSGYDVEYTNPTSVVVKPNPQTMMFKGDYVYLGICSKIGLDLKISYSLV